MKNNQYIALRRAMMNPTSVMETFLPTACDPFSNDQNKVNGFTYAQLCEIKMKHPELYDCIMNDSTL